MRKQRLAALVFFSCLALLSACTQKNGAARNPNAAQTDAPAADTVAIPAEIPAAPASLSDMTVYVFEDYGISVALPAAWPEPISSANEYGMTAASATDDFGESMFIIVRETLAEAPALEEYAASSDIREGYAGCVFEYDAIVNIGGVNFWKLVLKDETPGMESYQVIYTAFQNSCAYEVTLTLSPEFYQDNERLLLDMENGIVIR